MAYKFQLDDAIMSGTLIQEGATEVVGNLTATGGVISGSSLTLGSAAFSVSAAGAIAGATSIDGSGDLTVGTITMAEFTVAANGNTDIDGTLNVEGVPTFQAGAVFSGGVTTANAIAGATTISGSGLLSAAGGINAGNEGFTVSSTGAVVAASLNNSSGGITNAGSIAGATTIDASGDLTVGTITNAEFTVDASGNTDIDGTLNVEGVPTFQAGAVFSGGVTTANAIAGATTITGSGLLTMNDLSITQTSLLSGDIALSGPAETTVSVAAHSLYFLDATTGKVRRDTLADYAAAIVASEPGLASASGKIQYDPNSLNSGSVNVAEDFFSFVDADDSDLPKKDSIVDLVSAIAGGGLTATNGVLSTQAGAVSGGMDGGTATEGYNYFTGTVNAAVKLPASPSNGDVVIIKAGNTSAGQNITINCQGSHKIDEDATNIHLESPYAAVTLVYVKANDWRLV